MQLVSRIILIISLNLFFVQLSLSQSLKWSSTPRNEANHRAGWFISKTNPLELLFWQFDWNTRKLVVMDGALSNNPLMDITLSNYEAYYFASEINSRDLDFNGDGENDLIIIANYPQPSRYGIKIISFRNGQTLFELDNSSYSYNFLNVFDYDSDGKLEIAVNSENLSDGLTETQVYATNGNATSMNEYIDNIPDIYKLNQNFPNPFNPSTTIEYEINKQENVKINIYDVTGRLVKELVNAQRNTGKHSAIWNGRDNSGNIVASGNYFYQIISGDFVQAKKMILLK